MAEKKIVAEKNATIKNKMGSIKAKPTSSTAAAKAKKEVTSADTKSKKVLELKKLFAETIAIDVQMQREMHKIEKNFEKKYEELFEKRTKVLEKFKKDNVSHETDLNHFWLKVLKACLTHYITDDDEKVMKHLTDVRSKLFNDQLPVRFTVEFHFEANPYFSNSVLVKTYYVKTSPDKDEPLSYEGAEVYKSKGCAIKWKNNSLAKTAERRSTFFDFFKPPVLPKDPQDPNYEDIESVLETDYLLGTYLTERIIPKAIMFFTGEAADCADTDTTSSAKSSSTTAPTEHSSSN